MLYLKRLKIKRILKKLKALQHNRQHNQTSDQDVAKEMAYYQELAGLYDALIGNKHYPFAGEMARECLRASTNLADSAAQYQLAKRLLAEAKLREQLQREGLFANPSNERQMRHLYEEAHAYLQAAENLNHIQARRLRGLCYINGWGVTVDKDKGFELVVQSIDQENSWDKVPQIFAAIGLNKPEFFSAIMSRRK